MKTLQNNFTTNEQSKRLLELGVPTDSADCCLNGSTVIVLNGKSFQEHYDEDLYFARLHLVEYPKYIPCWSVGRLIEIYEIGGENAGQWLSTDKNKSRVERLVQLYEENVTMLNFSKLED